MNVNVKTPRLNPRASKSFFTPKRPPSVSDGAVFLSEAEAVEHAVTGALEKFFKVEEVEVEAPKGNFTVIHRCGITGKLIAPPNYHRYSELLNKHHSQNLPAMAIEAIQARIESLREPEVIAQWVESMKKINRYTLLTPPQGKNSGVPEGESSAASTTASQIVSFDGVEGAMGYLAAHYKNELIKSAPQARINCKQIEILPKGEVRRSIDAARALQLIFPLETANTLRGRLRRMGFTLYKQGPKGVSYLTAVKRKFRLIGQTFAPEVQQVIECIEKNTEITDVELPKQMLGISLPPAQTAAPTPTTATPALTTEEDSALKKLRQTLQWLVEEGYVIHYGNGKLFVPAARLPNLPKAKDEEEDSAETTEEATETSTEAKPEEPGAAIPAEATTPTIPEKPPETV